MFAVKHSDNKLSSVLSGALSECGSRAIAQNLHFWISTFWALLHTWPVEQTGEWTLYLAVCKSCTLNWCEHCSWCDIHLTFLLACGFVVFSLLQRAGVIHHSMTVPALWLCIWRLHLVPLFDRKKFILCHWTNFSRRKGCVLPLFGSLKLAASKNTTYNTLWVCLNSKQPLARNYSVNMCTTHVNDNLTDHQNRWSEFI